MSINGTIFMMISLIGIILIVIAPFCCADEMAKPSYISEYDFVELTEQNFNNEVGKSPYLVMFYDSSCSDCKNLSSFVKDMIAFADTSDIIGVKMAKVDCSSAKTLCEKDNCNPYSLQACEDADVPSGRSKRLGGDSGKSNFEGDFDIKGCFAFDNSNYFNSLTDFYYGTGGSEEDMKIPPPKPNYRPSGYDCNIAVPDFRFYKNGLNSEAKYDYRSSKDNPKDLLYFIIQQMERLPVEDKDESTLLVESGCKMKVWTQFGRPRTYTWAAYGKLLEKGVCIGKNYRKDFAPEKEATKVFTTIEYQKVRNVDAKKQTLFVDIVMTLRWFDPNVKTKFSPEDRENGGITLSLRTIDNIWIPDMYIWNRTSIQSKQQWASLINAKIVSINNTNGLHNEIDETKNSKNMVEMKYEIKTTVFCQFEYSNYPMDEQICNISIGSSSNEAIFVLHDENGIYHSSSNYKAVNLMMSTTFFDDGIEHVRNKVGIKIQMNRLMKPFWMKYYIPCIAIVIVSEIGFVVPLTAIPGRVALLVTQFLTLVNLFIYQMSESPSASELNEVGRYLLVSLGFVVVALLEFAFVIMVNRRATQNKEAKTDIKNELNEGRRKASNKNNVKLMNSRLLILETTDEERRAQKWMHAIPSIQSVDFIALGLHFVSFLLFNIVYWTNQS